DILIFDEPTAVLTPQEIQELIVILRNLAAEGKTIILITHKLKEIMAVCDRVTVIRRGKVEETLNVGETTPDELAAKMVGREVRFEVAKERVEVGEAALVLRKVSAVDPRGVQVLRNLSLKVHKGEILG